MQRRDFLKTATASAAAIAVGSLEAQAASATSIINKKTTAKAVKTKSGLAEELAAIKETADQARRRGEKVNVALIGIGNRGDQVEGDMAATGLINVVALCDVDLEGEHCSRVLNKYPNAKRFQDFRRLFDEMKGKIDAVIVCTPDFAHFPIAMRAIKEGIHVYVEKPMAQTFYESELLIQAARKYPNVVTQMGNQGHSSESFYQFKAWTEAGIIKDVYRIDAHMNNWRRWHDWDVNIKKFPDAEPIPSTLDWEMWLMEKLHHDFSKQLHYGNWRSWYDFGMGAIGDWGAHLFDNAHDFLELGLPYRVEMIKAEGHNDYFFPMETTVSFRFPRRGLMPECELNWYDGQKNLPPIPEGYGSAVSGADVPASGQNSSGEKPKLSPGKIIYSKDLIFKGGSHNALLSIIPEEKAQQMKDSLPEVPKAPTTHAENFLLACLGHGTTNSPFEKAGVMTQVMNLGVVAQKTHSSFTFDARTKTIVDNPFANALLYGPAPKDGWEEYYKI